MNFGPKYMKVLFLTLAFFLCYPSLAQNRAVLVAAYEDKNKMLFTISPCCNEQIIVILVPGKVDLQSVKTLNHLYLESLRKYVSPSVAEYIKGDGIIGKLYRNIALFTKNNYSNLEYTTEIFSFSQLSELKKKLRQKLPKLDALNRVQKINQHFSEGMDAILIETVSEHKNNCIKPLQFLFQFNQPLLPGIILSSKEQNLDTELFFLSRERNFSLLHYKVFIPEMRIFENASLESIRDFYKTNMSSKINEGSQMFLEYIDPKDGIHNLFKSCRIDYKNDKLLLKSLSALGAHWVSDAGIRDVAISKYTLVNFRPYNTKALRIIGNKYQNKFFIRYVNLK